MASKLRRIRKYNWTKRRNTHGFRIRSKKSQNVLRNRRRKGRKQLTVQKK